MDKARVSNETIYKQTDEQQGGTELSYLHVNGGTRSERRQSADHHGKKERRERTEVWRGAVGAREGSLDCWPGTSP